MTFVQNPVESVILVYPVRGIIYMGVPIYTLCGLIMSSIK